MEFVSDFVSNNDNAATIKVVGVAWCRNAINEWFDL